MFIGLETYNTGYPIGRVHKVAPMQKDGKKANMHGKVSLELLVICDLSD